MCFLKNPKLAEISSLRTFCAGGDGTAGPCHGDSGYRRFRLFLVSGLTFSCLFLGGGFYVKANPFWTLRGIVSSSLLTEYVSCDVGSYAIYTRVVDFIGWIKLVVVEND